MTIPASTILGFLGVVAILCGGYLILAGLGIVDYVEH